MNYLVDILAWILAIIAMVCKAADKCKNLVKDCAMDLNSIEYDKAEKAPARAREACVAAVDNAYIAYQEAVKKAGNAEALARIKAQAKKDVLNEQFSKILVK